MRTRTVILHAFEDQSTGELGLGIKGMPREANNAAHTGMLIAHDLIEHVNGIERIGSIDDELEALGGIWWVRGQWNDLSHDGTGSYYTVHENIAWDITRMFRAYFYGQHVSMTVRPSRRCEVDDDLRQIIEHVVKEVPSEIDEDPTEVRHKLQLYIRVCLPRMRMGYRKCRARFRGYPAVMANNLFWTISDAVDPHARHVEFEGQEFELSYGIKDGRPFAHCEERREWE